MNQFSYRWISKSQSSLNWLNIFMKTYSICEKVYSFDQGPDIHGHIDFSHYSVYDGSEKRYPQTDCIRAVDICLSPPLVSSTIWNFPLGTTIADDHNYRIINIIITQDLDSANSLCNAFLDMLVAYISNLCRSHTVSSWPPYKSVSLYL